MHPRLVEISSFLDASRADVFSAVAGRPETSLETSPPEGGWSVAQVLQHLALVESLTCSYLNRRLADAVAAGLPRERDESPVTDTVGPRLQGDSRESAPPAVTPAPHVTATEAVAALHRSRRDLHTTIAAGDGWALAEVPTKHPLLGPLDMYRSLLFIGHHDRRHEKQIRRILGCR